MGGKAIMTLTSHLHCADYDLARAKEVVKKFHTHNIPPQGINLQEQFLGNTNKICTIMVNIMFGIDTK